MNQELIDRLKEMGLDDNQIEKLQVLGATSAEDLAGLKEEELAEMGLPVLKARRIVREFSQANQPAGAPTQTGPLKISIANDDPMRMRTRELLKAVAGGEIDDDFVSVLRSRLFGRVFVRIENGDAIDVDATLAANTYSKETGRELDTWEGRVTETLDEVLDKRRQADPLNGEPLQNGRAPDGVDWSKVSEANRVLAAFARLNGHLRGNEDRFTLVRELEEPNPGGRWSNILALFKSAERNDPDKLISARASLIWRSRQAQMPPFGINPTSVGGGNIYAPPVDLPGQVSLPTMPAFGRLVLQHLKRHELEAVIEEGGHNTGNLPYNTDLQTFAREAIHHFSRRSQVGNLLRAAYKLHPEVDWAVELGLVPSDAPRMQKAGFGDTVFTGNASGAIINYGTTIIGGSQTINNRDK